MGHVVMHTAVHAAVGFFERGPANTGLDIHRPGGVTAAVICAAVERVTGNAVGYAEFPGGTRESVDGYPISETHKEIHAELFDYFRATEHLGDPRPITEALDGSRYGTVEDFVRRELFAGVAA